MLLCHCCCCSCSCSCSCCCVVCVCVCVWYWEKNQKSIFFYFFFKKIYRGKLSKLSVSYYVLITKSSFLGHFCVTNSLTHKLTHKLTDGKVELHSCMSQLKKNKDVWNVRKLRPCSFGTFEKKKFWKKFFWKKIEKKF